MSYEEELLPGFEEVPETPTSYGALADKFITPPLSVIDSRQGYWQERKRSWASLGLRNFDGRKSDLLGFGDERSDFMGQKMKSMSHRTTSVFDPVLAEIIVTWFSPEGGKVLDPFAGGPARGIVSSILGREYVGIDLRPEQVDADVIFAETVCGPIPPRYIVGDSSVVAGEIDDSFDLVMTCPPYFDLERYSDDPHDLSAMDADGFSDSYRAVISACCGALARDGMAAFVVGDVRGKDGSYRDLPGLTIDAFEACGMGLYDRIIYIQPYGTAPVRAGKQFKATRKVCNVNEQILIFTGHGNIPRLGEVVSHAV